MRALFTTNWRILLCLSYTTFLIWPFFRLGQEFKNIFVRFLVQMKTSKFVFDIIWPLDTIQNSNDLGQNILPSICIWLWTWDRFLYGQALTFCTLCIKYIQLPIWYSSLNQIKYLLAFLGYFSFDSCSKLSFIPEING